MADRCFALSRRRPAENDAPRSIGKTGCPTIPVCTAKQGDGYEEGREDSPRTESLGREYGGQEHRTYDCQQAQSELASGLDAIRWRILTFPHADAVAPLELVLIPDARLQL